MRWLTVLLMGVLVGLLAMPVSASHTERESIELQVGQSRVVFIAGEGKRLFDWRADPAGILEFDIEGSVFAVKCVRPGTTHVTLKYTQGGEDHTRVIRVDCVEKETER